MNIDPDRFYDVFADYAMRNGGPDNAADYFTAMGMPAEVIEKARARLRAATGRVVGVTPMIRPAEVDTWYPGPLPSDRCWNHVTDSLREQGKGFLVEELDRSTTSIVALTPNPSEEARSARGLVVGYIQSGKTTNFTGVAAKLADRRYRMVIVLAGIHNALRSQTQERLNRDLVGDDGRWHRLTGLDDDFQLGGSGDAISYLTSEDKTTLLVVKKNAHVLRRVLKWLDNDQVRKALVDAPVLVIDDEADQASVATETINPLLRDLLEALPRGTYVGYTATPFANVFIDPTDSGDLYPRDFIYPLPRPEGYFGPEELFGRDDLGQGETGSDGYDMIREIPAEDEFLLRPSSNKEVDGFQPKFTPAVFDAIHWFILATAARRARGDDGHSSMLVHTSFQTRVHDVYRSALSAEVARIGQRVSAGDEEFLGRLRRQWESETSRVPASDWGRQAEPFEVVAEHLPRVIEDLVVVADHSNSDDRLVYDDERPATVIAIGGNTLSRGLTLEGLVSSLFIRPTNTYDSLLQMGRWFGFRTGYEDLPRLWTTRVLHEAFRHLSLVEHEMRQDMEVYQLRGETPTDVAVKIRAHPSLRVTAKMGAAQPAVISFAGSRLQTRFFHRYDREWLEANHAAAEHLLARAQTRTTPVPVMDSARLIRNVEVNAVLEFLSTYRVVDQQTDMDTEMICDYIRKQNALDDPQLLRWNIAVVTGTGAETTFGGIDVKQVVRAPLNDSDEVADIKTLMSKEDLVLDLDGHTRAELRAMKESELKALRMDSEQVRGKGLLVLYPIDPESAPASERSRQARVDMDAAAPVVGVGLVFPRTSGSAADADTVQSTHFAVDLAEHPEEIDTDAEVFGSTE